MYCLVLAACVALGRYFSTFSINFKFMCNLIVVISLGSLSLPNEIEYLVSLRLHS